jgi:cyanate permease
VVERRSSWEKALDCTRTEILLEAFLAVVLLALGIALRPVRSTVLVIAGGLAAGLVVHICNRLVLAQPLFLRRIDWGVDPRPAAPRRSHSSGLLVAVLTAVGIGVVYTAAGRTWIALIAFFGGWFLAYALLALLQRIFLERDLARRINPR